MACVNTNMGAACSPRRSTIDATRRYHGVMDHARTRRVVSGTVALNIQVTRAPVPKVCI